MGVQCENLRGSLAALCHIEIGSCLHIGQQVLTLERGDVLVHIAKFSLNDTETVVNEHGGADGYLVLVLYPVLVIDRNQRVQQVFRTLDAYIHIRQIDDSRFLVTERYGQILRTVLYSRVKRGTGNVQSHFFSGVPIRRRGYDDKTCGSSERIARHSRNDGGIVLMFFAVTIIYEVLKSNHTVILHVHGKAERLAVGDFR